MIEMKTGYLEYRLEKSGGDNLKGPRPCTWPILSPGTGSSPPRPTGRVQVLINVEDFRESILAMKFGKSGYAYITDSGGNLVVHPFLTGNVFEGRDEDVQFFARKMCAMKTGKAVYSWKNPGETRPGKNL